MRLAPPLRGLPQLHLLALAVWAFLLVGVLLFVVQGLSEHFVHDSEDLTRQHLRQMVGMVQSNLEPELRALRAHRSTPQEVLKGVRQLFDRYSFEDETGIHYAFLLHNNGTLLAHPVLMSRAGINQWDMQDDQGNYPFRRLVGAARDGGGFVSYRYPKPGTSHWEQKLAYVAPFPELDAVLCSSASIGQIQKTGNSFIQLVTAFAAGAFLLLLIPVALVLRSYWNQTQTLAREMNQQRYSQSRIYESESRLRAVFEGAREIAFVLADADSRGARVVVFSPGAEAMFGIPQSEAVGTPLAGLMADMDQDQLEPLLAALRSGQDLGTQERQLVRQSGETFPALTGIHPVRDNDDSVSGVLMVSVDISDRKHSEALNYMLYRISDAVGSTRDLDHLYETIHGIFKEVIGAKNFFIAMLDEPGDRIVFPYYEDEMDGSTFEIRNISNPKSSSQTLHVLRTGEPLMITKEEKLRGDRGIVPVGTISEIWLGVPLKIRGKVIGAMAVQHYHDPNYFNEKDVDLMMAVSHQVGLVIERKMNAEALFEATRAAKAASRSKTEFLANMSHEIRTPLNGILGMADLTLGTKLDEEQRSNLEMLKESGQALLRVLNDILDISKIEAGKLELTEEIFEMEALLRSVVQIFSVEVRRKGIELTWDIDGDLPRVVRGDPGRLRQVLVNLVGNAVKFTDRGQVAVRVMRDALSIGAKSQVEEGEPVVFRFLVSDTGCGIPEDKLGTIFDSFTQADGSLRRRYQGTGLGLAISRRLTEMMGGGISVTSRKGEGATFEFTIVLREATSLVEQPQGAGERHLGQLRILLAEDNMVNMVYAKRILEREGHSVVTGTSGRSVLEVLERNSFDCILMDIQMPDMDGLEATRRIRMGQAGVQATNIPIVAMTAHAMKGDRERFLEAGMDSYIPKPMDPRLLHQVLLEVVGEG